MDSGISFPASWTAPNVLMSPPPRRARMAIGGIQSVILGTVVMLFFASGFLLYFTGPATELTRMWALRGGSSETAGVVTGVWSKRRTHMLSYAFTANGVALTGECSVPMDH